MGGGYSGPSLPHSLLEEVNNAKGGVSSHKLGTTNVSRRYSRKQQRAVKKQHKVQFFNTAQSNVKRSADREHEDSPQRKRQKLPQDIEDISYIPQTSTNLSSDVPSTGKRPPSSKPATKAKSQKVVPKPTALETLASRSEAGAIPAGSLTGARISRSQEEVHEDAYIARLEAKLGRKKGRKLSQEWEDDGLDELLKDLDNLEETLFTAGDRHLDEEASDMFEAGGEDEEGKGEWSEEEEEESVVDSAANEWGGFAHEAEDASGSKIDSEAHALFVPSFPVTRYVPPHLRNRQPDTVADSEALIKLKRQLKGLLNRLSEQNIASIVDDIEALYRDHRRHDVTSTITSLVVDGISAHSLLLDSYVVLHAALVSILHKLIGMEFAAYFVQNVVANYEKHLAALQDNSSDERPSADDLGTEESSGKEASNLIVLLSELYNFQVVSCLLVYDIIRGLLEDELSEFKVELLLKITRNSGQQLRSDDPTALKDIIQIVHTRVPQQQKDLSSRTKFMIETLTNLKNNRIKKSAAGQYAGGDAVERMKKFLSGLSKKRQVRAHEPLRVTLSDLHSADTKGKWWLVGAAWGGDPLVKHAGNNSPTNRVADGPSENTLLKLARKQGMNTDIRRNIFVVLMSSTDYVEACEKLSQLRLTEIQRREFMRVILHCCGNERRFNPYYTLVGQQLCRLSKSHQFTLQYCLWDFLRDLGETSVGGAEILKNVKNDEGKFDVKRISGTRISNVARAFGWWIAKDCCALAILKPVDFTILQSQSRTFLNQLLVYTLISTQLSTPLLSSDSKDHPETHHRGPLEEVFIKATRVPVLALGLIYFIGEIDQGDTEESGSAFLRWARNVALNTLRTGIDVVPNL